MDTCDWELFLRARVLLNMLSGELKCLVCLDNLINAKDSTHLDATCQFSKQNYLALVNLILSPVAFELSTEPLYLCRTCQGLLDSFEHHRIKVKDLKDAVLMRYKNIHSTDGSGAAEFCNSSSAVLTLGEEVTQSACPGRYFSTCIVTYGD